MITQRLARPFTEFGQRPNHKFCHECGAGMMEVDRRSESGALFVWYRCSQDGCDGQWLQKISPRKS